MKKVLLICTTSNSVVGFRASIIEKFQSEGFDVSVIAFDDTHKAEIEEKDIKFYNISDSNRGTNPLRLLSLKRRYKKIIKEIQPDIVLTFMLKPNTFGVLATKKAGIKNVFSMVEGAGDVFINNSLKWKLIRRVVCGLYKKAFKHSKKVFFLNNDDKAEFIQRKLVKEEQCEVIHGIGVDLEKFAYKPIKNDRTFLMVARMLKTKGVYEYCECARIVRQKYPDAVFNYLGAEGTVKISDIQEYIDDGSINYLGTTKDVRPYFEDCAVYVLPTYREGMSVSIMEAQAAGRAVITCDTNGCREMIKQDYNGFLIGIQNVEDLSDRVIWCIENPEKVIEMGKNARTFAEENFDSKKINQKVFEIITAEN